MKNKYITFSPYHAGLCNVIMSYELAFSISYITNRTLVLPPNNFICFISGNKKNQYIDIWDIFDRDYVNQNCNCIDFYKVPELKEKYNLLGNDISYTKNISKFIDDITEIKFSDSYNKEEINDCIAESHSVLVSNDYDDPDFVSFCSRREVLNLSKIDTKFIHFEGNLFGPYWYHVYPGNYEERNLMKKKINKIFTYKSKFYNFGELISSKIKKYNAVHIRRNDFLDARLEKIENVSSKQKILDRLRQFFDNSIPLYIATDEVDKSFFDLVRKEFQVYFFDDVYDFLECNLNELEKTVLEQIICLNAKKFYGTYYSTYSSRINILRGIEGKQSDDNIGLNYTKNPINLMRINPWKYEKNGQWEWCSSSHPQWKIEIDGIYV